MESKPAPRIFRRGLILRALVLAIPGLLLIWLVITQGVTAATRFGQPDIALAQQPWDARAQAASAERLITQNPRSAAARAQARQLATQALTRDPTVASAAGVLGLIASAENQPDRALAFFRLSERLSRRNLPTQLWLIEERVSHNDIRGALAHYDIALRTSSEAPELLYPILVAATREESIVQPLAEFLKRDPPWRRGFVERLVGGPPDPDRAVALMVSISAGRTPNEQALMRDLLARLVEGRRFAAAARLYREVVDPTHARAEAALLVRNGGFGRDNAAPPFDWLLVQEGGLSAEQQIVPNDGDGPVLALRATAPGGGVAARQIVLLPSGAYEFSMRAGPLPDTAPAQLTVSINCMNGGQTNILTLRPALRRGVQSALFHVPADCQAQVLQAGVADDQENDSRGAWIDSIQIRPRGAGGAI